MKLELFVEEMRKRLEAELRICKISPIDIYKNNGVVLKGIKITKEGCLVSPTIYLENYYKRYELGESMNELVADIVTYYQYSENKQPMNVEKYSVFELVKDRIVYKLINYEKNKKLLEETPFIPFLDLAIVFYYICENSFQSQSTILIKNNHLHIWKQTKEIIFEIAVKNTPKLLKVSIKGMQSVIKEMLVQEEFDANLIEQMEMNKQQEDMYVLTNQNGIFGAACILYHKVLESFSNKIRRDFYILPSSIHEVILVPKKEKMESSRLKKMVEEVNESEVLEEEILSNNVYYYSFQNQKFTIA